MKVTIPEHLKTVITIADLPAVREVITGCEELDIIEHAEIAARAIFGDNTVKILEADAEITINERVMNAYSEHSGHYDVTITFMALGGMGYYKGFAIVDAYLTEIWKINSNDYTTIGEFKKHSFIRMFNEEAQPDPNEGCEGVGGISPFYAESTDSE